MKGWSHYSDFRYQNGSEASPADWIHVDGATRKRRKQKYKRRKRTRTRNEEQKVWNEKNITKKEKK